MLYVKKDTKIKVSISHTTRGKRIGEEDGVHYYFIDKIEFKNMIEDKEFLEYANVYNHYYGTHKLTINQLLGTGYDIILEIDHQGAMQIRKLLKNAILIYIFPPSLVELEKRLRLRNTDTDLVINKRLSLALNDMSYAKYFDFGIVNDDFNQALDKLYSIITVHRLQVKNILKQLEYCLDISNAHKQE
jgi:guanylate kinase